MNHVRTLHSSDPDRGFLQRPQDTALRRLLFQVHLWTGVILAAYVIVVGITGAALMFRPEMQASTYPRFFEVDGGNDTAPTALIIQAFEAAYPGAVLVGIDYPTARRESLLAYLTDDTGLITAFADPGSAEILGELPSASWITWLQNLHINLLGGPTGLLVNGLGALGLALLCLTGPLIWWPGTGRWRAALRVDLRRGWRRAVWELHGAAGAWTVVLLLMWAVTGAEFAFPAPFRAVVDAWLPVTTGTAPQSGAEGAGAPPALATLVARAHLAVPGARLGRVVTPTGARAPLQILMAHEDHGDVVLTWMGRLHTGAFGGVPVKLAWFAVGMTLPLMAVTGLVMWANRLRGRARG